MAPGNRTPLWKSKYMENLYTTGKYTKQNPSYHVEDSEFKSNNFIKILKKNNFNFHQIYNVIDVGCGAGKILKIFQNSNLFNNQTNFKGFDINSEIINFANKEKNKNLNFYCDDFFKSNSYGESDLIICADVYEHIEDYIGFLKKLLPILSEYLVDFSSIIPSLSSDNFNSDSEHNIPYEVTPLILLSVSFILFFGIIDPGPA